MIGVSDDVETKKGLELFLKRLSNMKKSLDDYEQCPKTLELRKNLTNDLVKSYNAFFSQRKAEIEEDNSLLDLVIEIERLKSAVNPPSFF
jgi:hypothetical protein